MSKIEYPKWVYNQDGEGVIINSPEECPEGYGERRAVQEIKGEAPPEKEVRKWSNAELEKPVFTKESLEAVFEEKGIKGLRLIGNSFGVKGRSKDGLISDILGAQDDAK